MRILLLVVLATTAAFGHERITTNISWAREIAPLVQSRCVSCHAPGGRGPMPLVTYADARPWARAIREEVLARRMPKWHAARGYGDFLNDPTLSPFEIAMIVAWVDGGAPENPPKNSAPAPAVLPGSHVEKPLPAGACEVTLRCADTRLPAGEVLAVRPRLGRGGSAGISVLLPSGRREVVAWIRDFEPEFAETYWLRMPVPRRPSRRLLVEATSPCSLTLIMR